MNKLGISRILVIIFRITLFSPMILLNSLSVSCADKFPNNSANSISTLRFVIFSHIYWKSFPVSFKFWTIFFKSSILIPSSAWVIKFINRSFANTKKLTSLKYDSNLMMLSSWIGKKYTFCFFPRYLSLNRFISGIKLSIIFFALASASLSFVCISSIFL